MRRQRWDGSCTTNLLNDVLLLATIASADERNRQRDRLEPALEVGDAELDRIRDQAVHFERPCLAGRLIDPRHSAMRADVEERRRRQEAVVVEDLELGLAIERVLRRQLGRARDAGHTLPVRRTMRASRGIQLSGVFSSSSRTALASGCDGTGGKVSAPSPVNARGSRFSAEPSSPAG